MLLQVESGQMKNQLTYFGVIFDHGLARWVDIHVEKVAESLRSRDSGLVCLEETGVVVEMKVEAVDWEAQATNHRPSAGPATTRFYRSWADRAVAGFPFMLM